MGEGCAAGGAFVFGLGSAGFESGEWNACDGAVVFRVQGAGSEDQALDEGRKSMCEHRIPAGSYCGRCD